jgi:surface polysaccharide O-acyltransferase-like enzyme
VPPPRRYHSLDALRAAMMLLGLVLHSAASYTLGPLGRAWPYQDARTSVAFDLLLFFIHLFRMPVFFLVSGFFAALLYRRDGPGGFARNRGRRVLLPLVLFWPFVVPTAGLGFVFALERIGAAAPWRELTGGEPLAHKPLLGHLWFLYDLLWLYAAALVVVPFAVATPVRVRDGANALVRSIVTSRWGVFVLAAATVVTLLPMPVAGIETSAAIVPPLRVLAAYGVFFAFGWMLYGNRDVIASLGGRWKTSLATGLSSSVVYLIVLAGRPIDNPVGAHAAGVALASLSIWLLIFGILGCFVRRLDAPRPLVRYFSDASYWMYLAHLPVVIWLAGVLAHLTAPAWVKFGIVLAGTTLVTTITYHYLVRSTAIGALLSGRRYPRSAGAFNPAGEPRTTTTGFP